MTPLPKLAGIAAGSVATASVVTWIAVGHHASSATAVPTFDSGENDDVVVCVGSDEVLRRAPPEGSCPPNTTRIALSGPDHQAKDLTDDTTDPFAGAGATAQGPSGKGPRRVAGSLEDIERRIDLLEKAPLFEVADKQGNVIFYVAEGRADLYNSAGNVVAGIRATALGGFFQGRSADGLLAATIGVSGASAGVSIQEAGLTRIDMGRQQAGNYSLRFQSRVGSTLAGIGESQAGSGVMLVADPEGHKRVSMSINEGRGSLELFNAQGMALLDLSQKDSGGGMLTIRAGDGTAMVKMTNNDERYGVVMTGPRASLPYVPSSGLPGSYFLGCAAGPACMP